MIFFCTGSKLLPIAHSSQLTPTHTVASVFHHCFNDINKSAVLDFCDQDEFLESGFGMIIALPLHIPTFNLVYSLILMDLVISILNIYT